MAWIDILLKIILPILTGGVFLLYHSLKYNVDIHIQDLRVLKTDFTDLAKSYQETREDLIKLKAEAVTQNELKDMLREFEQRLDQQFDSKFKTLNENITLKIEALKAILTKEP